MRKIVCTNAKYFVHIVYKFCTQKQFFTNFFILHLKITKNFVHKTHILYTEKYHLYTNCTHKLPNLLDNFVINIDAFATKVHFFFDRLHNFLLEIYRQIRRDYNVYESNFRPQNQQLHN